MTGELQIQPKNASCSLSGKVHGQLYHFAESDNKMYASEPGVYLSPYFLTMPANELSELLDASFDTFSDIDNEYYRC